MLTLLGFIVHLTKSLFKPFQKIEYLYFGLNSVSIQFISTTQFNPPWVFFTFFKLYKWYQIAQRITISSNLIVVTSSRLFYRELERCRTKALQKNLREILIKMLTHAKKKKKKKLTNAKKYLPTL